MSRKVHMQDQAFNQVKQIMNHRYRLPVEFHLAGKVVSIQVPAGIGILGFLGTRKTSPSPPSPLADDASFGPVWRT